jgi:hypothetical protein
MVTTGVTPSAGPQGTTPADAGRQPRPGAPRRGSCASGPLTRRVALPGPGLLATSGRHRPGRPATLGKRLDPENLRALPRTPALLEDQLSWPYAFSYLPRTLAVCTPPVF